jgi:hypothetical protein
VIASVFRSWAHVDPKEALQNAAKVRFSGQRELAKDAIYAGWDESGKPGLWEASSELTLADQQRLAQVVARRRVVTMGFAKALEWAQSFPNPDMQQMVTLRVASAAANFKHGAPEVAEWATPVIVSAEQPTQLPRRIGTRWVKHDPLAAMAWLSSLPAGVDRDDGVIESYRDWMVNDFPAAEKWIREKIGAEEIEAWCEPAVSVFTKTNGLSRPAESLEIAARFKDESLRDTTRVLILVHWFKRDPAAAQAWLDEADLPPDVRARAQMGIANLPPEQTGVPHGPLGPPERGPLGLAAPK